MRSTGRDGFTDNFEVAGFYVVLGPAALYITNQATRCGFSILQIVIRFR